ncbi:MAG: hypothetical protein GXP26_06840 [Planctomycetes bacterium]|nr:hypothetical protein [Planctomycetota bacterium]
MTNDPFPPGWNEQRVRKVLEHYENQTEEQAFAEDEADFTDRPETVVSVPVDLIPAVRELIGKQNPVDS